jgi:transcriptional regulator with XRE-family HTH domain
MKALKRTGAPAGPEEMSARTGVPEAAKDGSRAMHSKGKPGSKAERDELRNRMLASGFTLDQVVVEMARRWRFRPRQAWRYVHGLTQDQVAARYNMLVPDDRQHMTGKRISDYEAWPNGGVKPPPHVLVALARIYKTSPAQLVDFLDQQRMRPADQLFLTLANDSINGDDDPKSRPNDSAKGIDAASLEYISSAETAHHRPATPTSGENRQTLNLKSYFETLLNEAARESLEHSERMESRAMSPETLEELHGEVTRLTREHLYINSTELFGDTVRARNRVFRLLESHHRPDQISDLYLLAGILCSLLADTSVSVGYPRAALDQVQAAWTYAELLNHNGLRIWCRNMQASIAYWQRRYHRALELTEASRPYVTNPISEVQVSSAEALFRACVADHEGARVALRRAADAREQVDGSHELFDRLGGMFAYPQAKQSRAAAMTYIELQDYASAARESQLAIDLYAGGPVEERAFGLEASARIDLARAHLLGGDLDASEETLGAVLALPSSQRQEWFVERLREFLPMLAKPPFAASEEAVRLALAIEEFCTQTAASEIPQAGV